MPCNCVPRLRRGTSFACPSDSVFCQGLVHIGAEWCFKSPKSLALGQGDTYKPPFHVQIQASPPKSESNGSPPKRGRVGGFQGPTKWRPTRLSSYRFFASPGMHHPPNVSTLQSKVQDSRGGPSERYFRIARATAPNNDTGTIRHYPHAPRSAWNICANRPLDV